MKLKLNKKKIKNLSNDNKKIPAEMTPLIAGAGTTGCDEWALPTGNGPHCKVP
ncbi:hypothetical protein [Pseudoalteromonas denitrificans]|jgi:hypothetical protein|uniref:Uncharacterized protein n=1 Tax=Pseudoalteromonas denitrificans DSM 6059 TaxID=1123010 RepID=A0A1I1UF54_9GAMM|nr:hypothetical protein [Pseudoalteromonas denitrificans]SFD67403.1 hypothetical protein SAMN02745724_05158 [Pseudoalteromonas denitrificans DSM 6059]